MGFGPIGTDPMLERCGLPHIQEVTMTVRIKIDPRTIRK
jgi:hypothetical protein